MKVRTDPGLLLAWEMLKKDMSKLGLHAEIVSPDGIVISRKIEAEWVVLTYVTSFDELQGFVLGWNAHIGAIEK
jgi:hypothetical protein